MEHYSQDNNIDQYGGMSGPFRNDAEQKKLDPKKKRLYNRIYTSL